MGLVFRVLIVVDNFNGECPIYPAGLFSARIGHSLVHTEYATSVKKGLLRQTRDPHGLEQDGTSIY